MGCLRATPRRASPAGQCARGCPRCDRTTNFFLFCSFIEPHPQERDSKDVGWIFDAHLWLTCRWTRRVADVVQALEIRATNFVTHMQDFPIERVNRHERKWTKISLFSPNSQHPIARRVSMEKHNYTRNKKVRRTWTKKKFEQVSRRPIVSAENLSTIDPIKISLRVEYLEWINASLLLFMPSLMELVYTSEIN